MFTRRYGIDAPYVLAGLLGVAAVFVVLAWFLNWSWLIPAVAFFASAAVYLHTRLRGKPGGRLVLVDIKHVNDYVTALTDVMNNLQRRSLGINYWYGGPWVSASVVNGVRR